MQRDRKPALLRAGGQSQSRDGSLAAGAVVLHSGGAGKHPQREGAPGGADKDLQRANASGRP